MENRLLNKKDVCEYLGISLGNLDGMIKKRKINYIKLDRLVRFRKKDLESILLKNEVNYE